MQIILYPILWLILSSNRVFPIPPAIVLGIGFVTLSSDISSRIMPIVSPLAVLSRLSIPVVI